MEKEGVWCMQEWGAGPLSFSAVLALYMQAWLAGCSWQPVVYFKTVARLIVLLTKAEWC